MISKELRKALRENNLVVNFGLSTDIIQCKRKKILEIFKKNGFENINQTLINFLYFFLDKEFLLVNGFSPPDSIHFKLERSLKITYAVRTIESDFDLGGLIPFGMLYREYMNLFIDSGDNVYANMDNILIYYGNNPFDALTNILNNKELERIEI